MVKKGKEGVEIDEVKKLTEVAKSWEFTCSFCFKKFPSAQAMGGHQNAHRSQRLEEKRLFVRDPITYRKRAFLRAIKSSAIEGESTSFEHLDHAAAKMVTAENVGEINDAACNCFYQRSSSKDSSVDHKGSNTCTHFNLDLTLKL